MAIIAGTNGADVLVGGSSGNVLSGGAGNDTFVYQRGLADTSIADFGSIYFTAAIGGANETPPNPSPATGTFTGVLNRARTEFSFTATETGLDLGNQTPTTTDNVTAAHFHNGPPGTAGGIVWGFIGAPNNDANAVTVIDTVTGTVSSTWYVNEGNGTTLTAQIPSLLAGQLYINFHSTVIPAGEIRGQVLPVDTGADKIDLRDAHIGDFDTLSQLLKAVGNNTLISTTLNGQVSNLMIQGVTPGALTANDFIFSDATPINVFGTAAADDLFGAGGNDSVLGLDGNDRLFLAGGDDTADGGAGNDSIQGALGNDTLTGGAGDDSVNGNAGFDSVSGGDGNDQIFGGKDNDTLSGDAGNDTLSGDTGNDVLYGGAGADRFVERAGAGQDWIADFNFAEGDRIQLSAGTTFTVSSYQGQALLTLSSGDTIGLVGVTQAAFTNDYVVFG